MLLISHHLASGSCLSNAVCSKLLYNAVLEVYYYYRLHIYAPLPSFPIKQTHGSRKYTRVVGDLPSCDTLERRLRTKTRGSQYALVAKILDTTVAGPYALGFLATIKYIGVNKSSFAPATRQSAANAKLSAVFCVPPGARPTVSRRPTNLCAKPLPHHVIRAIVKKSENVPICLKSPARG